MYNCLRKHERKFLGHRGGGDSNEWHWWGRFGWCNVQSVWDTKKTSQYEFGNGWRLSSKSTWCIATQSCYKRQAEIGQSCGKLDKDVLYTSDCVFEEREHSGKQQSENGCMMLWWRNWKLLRILRRSRYWHWSPTSGHESTHQNYLMWVNIWFKLLVN